MLFSVYNERMSDYLDPNNEELLKDFFAEAEQQVEQLESNVLVIENDPSNHEAIDEIFRAAHTLKGGSATVEMMELSNFTHTVEDVLDEIRSDRLAVDEDVIDILLTSIDVIKAMLESRQNGNEYEENIDDIVEKLHKYIPTKEDKKKAKKAAKASVVAAPVPEQKAETTTATSEIVLPEISEDDFAELQQACEDKQKLWCVAVKFDENNPMNTVGGIQVFAALKNVGNVLKTVPDFEALYEDQFYENVYYYVATESTADQIEDIAFLSDVTLVTDAHLLESAVTGTAADPKIAGDKKSIPEKDTSEKQESADKENTNDSVKKTETSDKKEQKKEHPKNEKKEGHAQQSSILRVDSRRIDNLLNLVSEAVINKASFNQLALQMVNEMMHFQSLEAEFKDKFHTLIDRFPAYVDSVKEGNNVNDVRKQIQQEYGSVGAIFDSYESEIKSITAKFRSYTQNLGTIAGDLQEGVMKIWLIGTILIFITPSCKSPAIVPRFCV